MDVLAILAIIAPEFAGFDPAVIAGAIAIAEMEVAPNLCGGGKKRARVVAYYAAHVLTIGGRERGATGDVAALREGSLSIEYTNGRSNSNFNTTFGQEYDRLRRQCAFAPRTRIMGILKGLNNGCC